jgi:uncharacterized membrane protein YbhN (UPF0104 family)
LIKRLVTWLRYIVPLAGAFFIGRVIYFQWQKVREFDWAFDPLFLALSFLATSCWFFVRGWVWHTIVAHFGRPIAYRECIRIFALSELGRYIPGTVWQYLSRIYLAGRWGVHAPVALTSSLMDLLLMALAAIPLVLWRIDEVFPLVRRELRVLLVVFPFVAAVVLQPAVLNRLGRLLLPRLKMDYQPIELRFSEVVRLWITCLALWIAFGSGFALFARSLAPIRLAHGLHLVSNYAASWLVGLVSPFTPGGIVVRELVLGQLLQKILPPGPAQLIAVLSRLWLITLELFWALFSQIFFRTDPPPAGVVEPACSAL